MKEQLHTIPISDAMANAGECPFCYIERKTEEHMMDFVLGHGASYMEADIRDMTDREGFCRAHFKKMFDYGNSLGNAWILKTLYKRHLEEMDREFKHFKPENTGKKSGQNTFQAYMKTFFDMYKKHPEFRDQVAATKGFCLDHFKVLCEGADEMLSDKERKDFYDTMLPLMRENVERVYEDVAWFVEKYDYKNRDADWKNSKDAIQRGMQKLRGSDPSLPPHVLKK